MQINHHTENLLKNLIKEKKENPQIYLSKLELELLNIQEEDIRLYLKNQILLFEVYVNTLINSLEMHKGT